MQRYETFSAFLLRENISVEGLRWGKLLDEISKMMEKYLQTKSQTQNLLKIMKLAKVS